MTLQAMKKETGGGRFVYLDYLRCLSAFAVVVLHTAAQQWYKADTHSFDWFILDLYDTLVRWAVSVFVMISGALFLKKDITISNLYNKYIKRLTLAFVFWSIFYSVTLNHGSIISMLRGHYHMWFIPMIIGLYIAYPIIKEIIKNEKLTEYFLKISGIFVFTIPFIIQILKQFSNKNCMDIINTVNKTINLISPNIVLGYTSFFILGFYIHTHNLSRKTRIFIYIAGILSFIIGTILHKIAVIFNDRGGFFWGDTLLPVLLQSISIFTYIKYSNLKEKFYITLISKYTFGIYLIHAFILKKLEQAGLNTLSFNPILSIPVISLITFVISFVIVILLGQTPLKKFVK